MGLIDELLKIDTLLSVYTYGHSCVVLLRLRTWLISFNIFNGIYMRLAASVKTTIKICG